MKKATRENQGHVLITGGSGFIGSNLADRLLHLGEKVVLFDNLSRKGVVQNWNWLRARHGSRVELMEEDVRDAAAVSRAVEQASSVFHLAAQVAVTSSLEDPALDFEVNALGTFHVLEAVRLVNPEVPVLFTSTNKVYGCLEGINLLSDETRYYLEHRQHRNQGFDELLPLDFASPYGCSKGTADQYVLDYARSYKLETMVFRMSCIYGPRQLGTEDQGWVAHFMRAVMEDEPLTVYGDGCQVRDLLYVGDLVEAMLAARTNASQLAGQAFNIGGGDTNARSVREVLEAIGRLQGRHVQFEQGLWRCGDQKYYVSDFSKFRRATGWHPRVSVEEGLSLLHQWLETQTSATAGIAA